MDITSTRSAHSGKVLAAFLIVTCALLGGPVFAKGSGSLQPAPKGWMVVRSGAANTNANYDKEDRDINGKLMNVSVLCKGTKNAPALIATDGTRTWGATYGVSSTTTIWNKGGKVYKDPLDDNPNHCLIDGLGLGDLKGIWHMH